MHQKLKRMYKKHTQSHIFRAVSTGKRTLELHRRVNQNGSGISHVDECWKILLDQWGAETRPPLQKALPPPPDCGSTEEIPVIL